MHRYRRQIVGLLLPETKQRKLKGKPGPKKFKEISSAGNVMLTADFCGLLIAEYSFPRQNINSSTYFDMVLILRIKTEHNHLGLLLKTVFLLHDNVCPITSLLDNINWEVFSHPS